MQLRRLAFRPRPWAVAAALAGIALFVALGYWQLGRAAEKQALLALQASWFAAPAADLLALPANLEGQRFRPVLARGQYLGDRQVLVDNQVRHGLAGYRVLTPFAVPGQAALLLVDRGWVAGGGDRRAPPAPPPPAATTLIRGVLDNPPRMALRLASSVVVTEGWPLVVLELDGAHLERRLGAPILPLILRLAAAEPGALATPEAASRDLAAGRHRSYALQWFALAVAVAVLFVVVNLERSDEVG